ncbi:hypothetical protein ABBQ38_002395 [Trebouxia sp. C0009 RCD-2024]
MWARVASQQVAPRLAVISGAFVTKHTRRPSQRRLISGVVAAMSQSGEYSYKYPRPGLTVDACIVSQQTPPKILLIKRQKAPCKDQWALPGGFVDENEPLEKAAARELQEETSVNPKDVLLTQVGTFGDPGRDPRGWQVSVAYAALVPSTDMGVKAADDATEAEWYDITKLPALAFDHKLIIRTAFEHLLQHSQTKSTEGLAAALQKGAKNLQGPWTPPRE